MSGIAGLYQLNRAPVDRASVQRMVDILVHRGPDGANVWCDDAIGLGHCMLWTTPQSLIEQLPQVQGHLTITGDARIDNRAELLRALEFNQSPPDKVTDSEIILAAYLKWGEDCPGHLLGDFAFAIWDDRQQQVFCARDPLGVKPFYYCHQPQRLFAFASEIKALLTLDSIPRRLNETRIGDYMLFNFEDTAITFYKDIWCLPPASTLVVDQEGMRINRYWAFDPTRELRLKSNEEYSEAFREVFTEAVHCRLRSAFSIGSTLSGGMDSSSTSCVARDFLRAADKTPLHTFSLVFDQFPQSDERAYQNTVVQQGGIQPHQIAGDRISPLVDAERILWHLDEPHSHANFFLIWELFKTAQQQNVRVLLEGFDGDTAVSHGMGYFDELAHRGQWLKLAIEARAYARQYGGSARSIVLKGLQVHHVSPLLLRFPLMRSLRQWRQRRRGYEAQPWDSGFNPAFVQRTQLQERQAMQNHSLPRSERELHHRMVSTGKTSYLLEALNKIGGAFSIEPRFPFSDQRVLEFCLALPPEQKLHRGWTRMILRRAMTGILPPEIQWRPSKADLSPNFDRGLYAFEQQRLHQFMASDLDCIAPYLDIDTLRASFHRLAANQATSRDLTFVWSAQILSLWLKGSGLAT